jgi:hypothetical protein
MRRYNLQRRRNWLSVLAVLAIVSSGCGEQQLPEPKYPGASRDMLENPLGAGAKLKGIEEKAASQPKLSAKAKQAQENAAKADPRANK